MATPAPLLQNTKFEDLCRLCGSKTDMLAVHIFDDEGTFSELGKKIYNCLQLQIHQQDELPKLLCDSCLMKLEMFWEFKDRSFRTEQLLYELYRQLKDSAGQQQCVVSLDANNMILQVPNQILHEDLPTDIDISQLGRRDNSDYAVILPHDDLHAPHLENLELSNHDLTDQDLSNHGDRVVLPTPTPNDERFSAENMTLMQQHLLNEAQFKLHPELHMSMDNGDIYDNAVLKHGLVQESNPSNSYLQNTKEICESESLDTIDYSQQKVSESNLSDNSLGVEVDSHLDRIIYSSDSQIDQVQLKDETDSSTNLIVNHQSIENVTDLLHHDGNTGDDLTNFSFNSRMSLTDSQSHYFKYNNADYSESLEDTKFVAQYKEETLMNVFNNEDSSSVENPLINQTDDSIGNLEDSSEVAQTVTEDVKIKFSAKNGGKECTVCGKSYKTNYKLAEHMTKHTGERPYKCKSCDKSFRSKIGLAQHEAKHTGEYVLSCAICGKGFQCRSYLMVHQRVHSDLKPFPCTTCGLNFKTKQSLLDHTNRHLGVKPFSCSICNRGFITKSLCLAHEKTHTGVDNRKYSCKVCQKRFVSKSYLQTHFRIHTGEKPFICEVCGKGFLTRVDLKIHLTMHTGEKSYVCEMCGKAFARRDALKCHRRMHTGERPYQCDICGRTFTQFSPMANHKKQHSGEKPFTCEICGKTFVSKSAMASHQKMHSKSVEAKKKDQESVEARKKKKISKEEVTAENHPL